MYHTKDLHPEYISTSLVVRSKKTNNPIEKQYITVIDTPQKKVYD